MRTLEEAVEIVKRDIKLKTNTMMSYIHDLLNMKKNMQKDAIEILEQATVPIMTKWYIARSLDMVSDEDLKNNIFSDDMEEDEIKQIIIDKIVDDSRRD